MMPKTVKWRRCCRRMVDLVIWKEDPAINGEEKDDVFAQAVIEITQEVPCL